MELPLARMSKPRFIPGDWRRTLCAGLMLLCALRGAAADTTPDAAPLAGRLTEWVQAHAGGAAVAGPAGRRPRVEVSLGALDERIRLAPCLRMEPYLPPGTRPWGRIRIGLRCLEGATRWNVYLPATVRVFGQALTASADLAPGRALSAEVLRLAEVDLAAEASPALVDADALRGRSLARPLAAGQVLREHHLRPRQWFGVGETVRLLAQGRGFAIRSEGRALGPGLDGQTVRVMVEGGRVVSGIARAERTVEVLL